MQVDTVTTSDNRLLTAVRSTLQDADSALLCVAFASEAGVNLVQKELEHLGSQSRLLVTTTFATTTPAALYKVHKLGVEVRVLNPGGGTYHPKVYLGQGGGAAGAVIGSANLTGGLVNNVEVALHLRGRKQDQAIRDAWTWAEYMWGSSRAAVWTPDGKPEPGEEEFDETLLPLIDAEVARDPMFRTLGSPKPNVVTQVMALGLYIQTAKTVAQGTGPLLVPAWMFNLAWGYLRRHGALSNTFLLNELRVHRSSAVCAILARLPGVRRRPSRKIELEWGGL